jgi:hypothetical protein
VVKFLKLVTHKTLEFITNEFKNLTKEKKLAIKRIMDTFDRKKKPKKGEIIK